MEKYSTFNQLQLSYLLSENLQNPVNTVLGPLRASGDGVSASERL